MSADRLSLMVEQHSVLLFARAMRRSADEHRLAAQHDDESAIELTRRAQEIERYLAETGDPKLLQGPKCCEKARPGEQICADCASESAQWNEYMSPPTGDQMEEAQTTAEET